MTKLARTNGNVFASFDSILDRFFSGEGFNFLLPPITTGLYSSHFGRMNIQERTDRWDVQVLVPGVAAEDVDIEIKEDSLTVRAKNKVKEDLKDTELLRECSREFVEKHNVSRTLTFNEQRLDTDKSTAKLENGVLCISLYKKEIQELNKGKKLEVLS